MNHLENTKRDKFGDNGFANFDPFHVSITFQTAPDLLLIYSTSNVFPEQKLSDVFKFIRMHRMFFT